MPEQKIVNCQRCNKRCIGMKSQRPEARPFKHALQGLCTECIVSQFFQNADNEEGIGFALASAENFTPEGLRLPHIQEQFRRVLEVGMSELIFDEIDWDEVIANWDLPFPGKNFKGYREERADSERRRKNLREQQGGLFDA